MLRSKDLARSSECKALRVWPSAADKSTRNSARHAVDHYWTLNAIIAQNGAVTGQAHFTCAMFDLSCSVVGARGDAHGGWQPRSGILHPYYFSDGYLAPLGTGRKH